MRLATSKPNRLRATCTAVGSASALLLMSHVAALAQAALPTQTTADIDGRDVNAIIDTPGVVPPYMSGIVTWRDLNGRVLARAPVSNNYMMANGSGRAFAGDLLKEDPPAGPVQTIYSGDCTYAGSSDVTQARTVADRGTKGPNLAAGKRVEYHPATGTALIAGSGQWDQPTTLVALVLGVRNVPPNDTVTGVVTFYDKADAVLGGAAVGADGTARLTVQPKRLAIGTNRLRATFNGTGPYAGDTSSACDSIVMFPPAGR